VLASLLGMFGVFQVSTAFLSADADPDHGGAYLILLGLFGLLAAGALGVAALCLRGTGRSGWLVQLLPLAFLAWCLWDVLSHPG